MSSFPNPLEWFRITLDVQKAQIAAAEKMIETGSTGLDPEKLEEAKQHLEEAGQQAVDAAEAWAKAQWDWLSLWRC